MRARFGIPVLIAGLAIAMLPCIAAGGCPMGGGGNLTFSAVADGRVMDGYTKYRIEFGDYDPEIGLEVGGASELEFPLDVFMAGATLGLAGKCCGTRPWALALSFGTNTDDPDDPMKDSDWFTLPDYDYSLMYSYTESAAEIDAVIGDASARIGLVALPQFGLDAVLGYRYQHFSYEVLGIMGWQLASVGDNFVRVEIDTLAGENVLDYDITYHLPYLGLAAQVKPSANFSVGMNLAFSPTATAEDRDNHLLRHKTAKADCSGQAYFGGAELTWKLCGSAMGRGWLLGMGADFVKIRTSGDQDQTWYGDDPITPDVDDTGSVITNICDEITSVSKSVVFRLGYEF